MLPAAIRPAANQVLIPNDTTNHRFRPPNRRIYAPAKEIAGSATLGIADTTSIERGIEAVLILILTTTLPSLHRQASDPRY